MPAIRIVHRGLLLLAILLGLSPGLALAQTGAAETTGKTTVWLPEDVSTYGHEIDALFYFIFWMTMIVGIAVFIVLIWFLWQYRYNPNRTAKYIHGNVRLEIVWTLIPALLMALTAAVSQSTWAKIKNPSDWPNEAEMTAKTLKGEVIHVEVVAQQFSWVSHYPGPDGKLGKRDATKVDKSSQDLRNQIGLDPDDANGKDDVVTGVLVVPVNRKVHVELVSVDVLHSFFLPNFRVKQDAVPGINGKVWFEATRTSGDVIGRVRAEDAVGDQATFFNAAKPYDIVCAELCGLGHYSMRGQMFVVAQDEYDRWMGEQVKKAKKAMESEDGF